MTGLTSRALQIRHIFNIPLHICNRMEDTREQVVSVFSLLFNPASKKMKHQTFNIFFIKAFLTKSMLCNMYTCDRSLSQGKYYGYTMGVLDL